MISRVYFETNSLRGRWPGRISGELLTVAYLARRLGIELCIPHSAVVEHENSIIHHVIEDVNKARAAIRRANTILNGIVPSLETPACDDEETLRASHRAAVAKTIADYRLVIVPTSQLSIEEFVKMAARRVPPFKDEDRGFRDAVHIHSILDHLKGTPVNDAVLISNDAELGSKGLDEVITANGVSLRVVSFGELIRELQTNLDEPELTQLTFIRETVKADVTGLLVEFLPSIANRLLYARLPVSGGQCEVVSISKATFGGLESHTGSITAGPRANTYRVDLEAYLDLQGRCEYLGPVQPRLAVLFYPKLMLAADVFIVLNSIGEISQVTFESARVFAVKWPDVRDPQFRYTEVHNLPEPIELVGIPVGFELRTSDKRRNQNATTK